MHKIIPFNRNNKSIYKEIRSPLFATSYLRSPAGGVWCGVSSTRLGLMYSSFTLQQQGRPKGRLYKVVHLKAEVIDFFFFFCKWLQKQNLIHCFWFQLFSSLPLAKETWHQRGSGQIRFTLESRTHHFSQVPVDPAPAPWNRTSNLICHWCRPWSRECRLPESQ